MEKGDLSNKPAPTILFHYDFLLDEKKKLFRHWLEWKTNELRDFNRFLQLDWLNLLIVCPNAKKKLVQLYLDMTPVNSVYGYEDISDVVNLTKEPGNRIVAYYDKNTQRGQLFGSIWRDK